jgi:hypothetical protein
MDHTRPISAKRLGESLQIEHVIQFGLEANGRTFGRRVVVEAVQPIELLGRAVLAIFECGEILLPATDPRVLGERFDEIGTAAATLEQHDKGSTLFV